MILEIGIHENVLHDGTGSMIVLNTSFLGSIDVPQMNINCIFLASYFTGFFRTSNEKILITSVVVPLYNSHIRPGD